MYAPQTAAARLPVAARHCNGTKAKRMRLIGGQNKMPVLCKHMVKMGTQAAWARAKHTGLVGARTSMNP